MRSLVVDRFGAPQQVLTLRAQPLPQPGPGELRLKLILSPIHTHDLELVRGEYGHHPPLPFTPGTEAVARVDALGPQVRHLRIGQRVAVAGVNGTWAECFLADARRVVPVPDALPDEAACQLLAMPLSASMLVDELALQPGEWMIQNAANGAVGRIVNVLAQRRGAQVINLVRNAAAAESLRAAGQAHVLCSDDPHWQERAVQMTQGAALLRAVDSLGGDAPNQLLRVMSAGGTLISFGSAVSLTLNLHVDQLLYRQATVRGFWAAPRGAALDPADRARMIAEVIQLVLDGQLALPLAGCHDLADAAGAAAAAARPQRGGKVALRA